jgi:hypothetical protein
MWTDKVKRMYRCLRSRILGSRIPVTQAEAVAQQMAQSTVELKQQTARLDRALEEIKRKPDPFAALVHNFRNSHHRHNVRQGR